MSHTCMSHVTHMYESCHIHVWVMSHTCMSHVTCFQTLMARFLVLIESFYTHACVISHTWMSHVTCLLHEWVMSHTWRHTFRYWWIGIGSFPNESCHMSILWLFTSHTWIHRITHMNESCLMSITWISHVTRMNVSSHTPQTDEIVLKIITTAKISDKFSR